MSSLTKAAPMTKDETMLLVQLVAANKNINNKATNATNNKLKEQAWQNISNEFNSSITSFPRTPSQLRLKWENLKKAARKCAANMRSSLNKTGGGKDYFPPDEVLDKVAALLGNTCQGFTVEVGGDATINQNAILLGEDDNCLDGDRFIINIENNNHGVGDVVYDGSHGGGGDGRAGEGSLGDGGVVDVLVTETHNTNTPSSRQRNMFFSRASGSGALAKRKQRMEEEKYKARMFRDTAMAEYLTSKKKKLDLENQETELTIKKLQLELENAKMENIKLKADK